MENFGVRLALAILDLLATKGPAVDGGLECPSGKRNGDEVDGRSAYAAPFASLGALKGMPNSVNKARASSLVDAEVTKLIFIP